MSEIPELLKIVMGVMSGLILLLLGTYLGFLSAIMKKLGKVESAAMTTADSVKASVKGEIDELRLYIAINFVQEKTCISNEGLNRTAHENLWKEHNVLAQDVSKIEGRMNGAGK